jgi:hypothetical protein
MNTEHLVLCIFLHTNMIFTKVNNTLDKNVEYYVHENPVQAYIYISICESSCVTHELLPLTETFKAAVSMSWYSMAIVSGRVPHSINPMMVCQF